MTTTYTIGTGGGRDYSSPTAFEAALPGTPVDHYVGDSYNDSEFAISASIVFSGVTTSPSATVTLTAAAGQSFVDHVDRLTNPLRYDVSKGVGIRKTNAFQDVIQVQQDYTYLKRLQIAHSGGQGSTCYTNAFGGATITERNTDQCLFQHDSSGNNNTLTLKTGKHTNFVAIQNNDCNVACISLSFPNLVTVANATIVGASDKAVTGPAFSNSTASASSFVATNVAAFGFSGGFASNNDNTHGTANYCCTDQASIGLAGGTNNLTSKTYASQFEGTTSAALDFRVKAGADLINAGAVDTTDIPAAVDIVGTSRPQGAAWDIGCWERVVAAAHPRSYGIIF